MSLEAGGCLDELRSLISVGRVINDGDLLNTFATSQRGTRGQAAFAVEPGNVDEVREISAWAYRNSARLVVQGANTGLVEASVPDQSGTQGVLSLKRLNRIIDLSVEDRTVDVEAGLLLDDLNQILSGYNLFFPIELGSNPSIGGLAATNAGGARTIRYGTAGSRVVALEGVIADETGSVIGNLSPPTKDNSRLHTSRLLLGSYGALGVIGRLRLRLASIPSQTATAILALDGYEDAIECLAHLRQDLGESLSAFELISGEAMRLTIENMPQVPRAFHPLEHVCYVLVEGAHFNEAEDIEQDLARALEALSKPAAPLVADAVIGPPKEFWQIRHSLSEGVRSAGETLRFDISMSPRDLPAFHTAVCDLAASLPDSPIVTEFGHWAEGGTHLQLVYSQRPEDELHVRKAVYDLVVRRFRGSFSAEHGLGRYNAEFYRRYVTDSEKALEKRVKLAFDPRMVWGTDPFSGR